MIFHGLPEMFGGIIGGTVEQDTFLDGIPVREYASGNRRRGTPAVHRMLPFFLYSQESFEIPGRQGFFHVRNCLAQFGGSVRDQRFKRTLVDHGDGTTLDAATEQFASEIPELRVVERAPPAFCLRLDVGEEFG